MKTFFLLRFSSGLGVQLHPLHPLCRRPCRYFTLTIQYNTFKYACFGNSLLQQGTNDTQVIQFLVWQNLVVAAPFSIPPQWDSSGANVAH